MPVCGNEVRKKVRGEGKNKEVFLAVMNNNTRKRKREEELM